MVLPIRERGIAGNKENNKYETEIFPQSKRG